jgi:hypothetical protein
MMGELMRVSTTNTSIARNINIDAPSCRRCDVVRTRDSHCDVPINDLSDVDEESVSETSFSYE